MDLVYKYAPEIADDLAERIRDRAQKWGYSPEAALASLCNVRMAMVNVGMRDKFYYMIMKSYTAGEDIRPYIAELINGLGYLDDLPLFLNIRDLHFAMDLSAQVSTRLVVYHNNICNERHCAVSARLEYI